MKEQTDKKIYDEHKAMVLFSLCWLVYFSSYIGRLNYSSAMPSMIGESVINVSQAGTISMIYFFAYGIGQLLNGILADKVSPGKMIFWGLFLSGIVNFIMGFLSHFSGMVLLWGVNGDLQAMIWPPIMRLFAERFTEEKKIKYCVHITSTMAVGTLASYLLSAAMIAFFHWRFAFYGAAVIMCGAALVFLKGYGKIEYAVKGYAGSLDRSELESSQGNSLIDRAGTKNMKENPSFYQFIISSGLLCILIPVIIHGVLKDGVTSWVPTFISETFHTDSSFSILVTTALPIINLTGAYAAQFVYQRLCKKREVKAAFLFFMTALTALWLLWQFPAVSVLLTAALFSIITASMMAVNTLFVNLLPLHFERQGKVSTVSGFLNAMAYLGSAVSTFTIGMIVENNGWSVAVFSWVVITAAAAFICFIAKNKRF